MSRALGVLIALTLASLGCQRANIVDCASDPDFPACEDGGGSDAATDATDASADATDASADASTDRYPVLFFDDFEDGDLGRWIITNPRGADPPPWTETRGALFSGPGRSTAFWNSPYCPDDVGPALLRSAETIPRGEGRFTIEVDVYSSSTGAPCTISQAVGLSDPERPTEWKAEPWLGLEWGRALGGVSVDLPPAAGGTTYVHVNRIDGPRAIEVRTHSAPGVAEPGRWYRLHLEMCGTDGYYVRLSTREGETLIEASDSAFAYVPSPALDSYYVELWADGTGKAFDDVTVLRGCPVIDAR